MAYGSPTWKVLMMHCRHLISSHIDLEIIRPRALTALGIKPGWDFTFLQHGVIKDDISGWLNLKNPAVFVTSTAAEYQSIAGDDNRYRFTAKEVKLTGLPRFDRLRELGIATAEEQRNLILFAPTWRDWLNSPLRPGSVRRELAPGFLQSEYAENWLGVLRSPELAELAERENLQIGFLPHPNLQSILAELDLPEHVQAMRYADHDVQKLFARAAVIVSDYSSIVFNAAYIDRPVVYFQFDRDRVESGGHLGRKGYFSYEDDGFGPVTYTVDLRPKYAAVWAMITLELIWASAPSE